MKRNKIGNTTEGLSFKLSQTNWRRLMRWLSLTKDLPVIVCTGEGEYPVISFEPMAAYARLSVQAGPA